MTELFSTAFLAAFLLFYSALFLVLLALGLRRALPSRRKRAREASSSERLRDLALSTQAERN
jgi:putative copper export protein